MKADAVFTRPTRAEKTPGRLFCARVDTRMCPLPDWSVRAMLEN